SAVASGLGRAFAGMVLLLGTVTLVARYLLRKPFAWAARSPETLVIWSLSWCFLVVALTHFLHLSAEIGAFAAGVSLAPLPYSHDLQRRVRPLMNFFVAVAFVIMGLGIELDAPAAAWITAGALSLFVFSGKFAILFFVIRRLGYAAKTAFFAALLLIQISEFSFIFMAQGVQQGLIDGATENIAGLVGLMTISLSTVMIGFKERLFGFATRLALQGSGDPAASEEYVASSSRRRPADEGEVIIVGMNSLGRELVRRFQGKGVPVVAIDRDPSKLAGVSCRTVLGDAKSRAVLREAGLEHARLLVSTLHIEAANDLLAYEAHRAGVRSAIHAVDLKATDHLLEMDVSYFIVPKADGLKRQSEELERLGFLKKSAP
ncbi:MAG: cation:proton antiporter, partial [Verrucomicrobiales bacterium]